MPMNQVQFDLTALIFYQCSQPIPICRVAVLLNMKVLFLFLALKSVSMGQGQEMHARHLISDSMAGGGWVLLQNIHLSLPFCNEAMDALVETENVHETFRLWMTTEVHTHFPIALLQVK